MIKTTTMTLNTLIETFEEAPIDSEWPKKLSIHNMIATRIKNLSMEICHFTERLKKLLTKDTASKQETAPSKGIMISD
jgi:hypothetical protein